MATLNYFTTKTSNLGSKTEPGSNASNFGVMVSTVEVAAADDDGSTYLLFQNVPSSLRILQSILMCDAITGGTDYDIGLYNPYTGVVVKKDILLDGQTLASASKTLNGIGTVDIADIGALKTLAELATAASVAVLPEYDIVLTANTVGSAAGTVTNILSGFSS